MKQTDRRPQKTPKDVGGRKPPVRTAAEETRTGAGAGRAGVQPAPSLEEQSALFDKAMERFHARDFGAAKTLFEAAARGPALAMAGAARTHAVMCEKRLARSVPAVMTAEDHYNLAVALINQRNVREAENHLREALAQAPDGDHLHYALALCQGLAGDINGAAASLRRAIDLQPRNKVLARSDPDFAEIGRHPAIRELLSAEKTYPG